MAKVHTSLSNSNYTVVRLGVGLADSISSTALSFVPEPVVSKVTAIGSPLLDAADSQLEMAYNRVKPMAATVGKRVTAVTGVFSKRVSEGVDAAQQYIMPQEWFAQVDSVVGARAAKDVRVERADILPLVQSFYNTAAYTFLALARRGVKDQGEFLSAVQAELDRVWTEKLHQPTVEFFQHARRVYDEAGLRARDVTTTSLLDAVKPMMGAGWEKELLASMDSSDVSGSQLVYLRALGLFTLLQSKLKEKKLQASELEAEFMEGMKAKLGSMYNEPLEKNLKQLIAAWTEKAEMQGKSLGTNVYERYQYLLLSAQHIFDRVLPPTITPEEEVAEEEEKKEEKEREKEKEKAPAAAEEPITLMNLASHVKDRVGERGVVGNVTTASSNSVKESVQLAGKVVHKGVDMASNVASQVVHTASSVVRPVVDPVISRVSPVVQPVVKASVDRALPVYVELNKQVQTQLQTTLQLAKAKMEQLQQFVNSISTQTRQGLLTAAETTKTSITNGATSAASSLQFSLPAPIASRLTDLQLRLKSALAYASQLRQDGQLQQQIAQLSYSYAEVAQVLVTEQLHALRESLPNAERLGQLMEDTSNSVRQLIQYTRKAVALESGLDEEEVTEAAAPARGAAKPADEVKTNAAAPREVI